jgi:RNA polymerase sigma-70 factor (ECF subfamily)
MGRSERGQDDASLVLRAREGDGDAFEALVRRHYRAAYAIARGRVESPMDAEDVVQDSLVKALERLDECDPERFAGWLLTIVRNRAHNARIYESRRAGVDPMAAGLTARDGGEGDGDARVRRRELREALEAAMTFLTPVQREVLLLHDLEGLAHAEIAGAVGVSVGMSRYHLMQARRRMREALSTNEPETDEHEG